jgi:hypothetical protein
MASTALARNIRFWHWFPEALVRDLTPEQLSQQVPEHDTTITFALWHAYRAADDLVHGLLLGRPSVFATQGWAARLPVAETGASPFGNGLGREQIAAIRLDPNELLAHIKAVGESINEAVAALSEAEAAEEISLPFFATAYPGFDVMTRAEAINFFAVGHTAEHLGEVQFLRGLLGLKGAPL